MRQATHDNTTSASRRGFLTTAAGVAAGGTALALTANVTAPALAAPLAASAASGYYADRGRVEG